MRWGVFGRGAVLALLLSACVSCIAPGVAAAKRLGPAPNCAAFEGSVIEFHLGALKGPTVTDIGAHQTTCVWSGQEPGKYGFVVTVSVYGAPSEVGKALLAAAKRSARKANGVPGGLGLVASKSPRHGNYFEGEALWSEEARDKETGKCPGIFNEEGVETGQNTAIEPGQSGPTCAGQPGTEGDFVTAYGSPIGRGARRPVEPMLLQISVACELDALSGGLLKLGRIASAVYAGRGY